MSSGESDNLFVCLVLKWTRNSVQDDSLVEIVFLLSK